MPRLPLSFDASSYANDEITQFLNSALVNNPAIPFPENGLSAIIRYSPIQQWYVSAAAADAQADERESGFRTTFYGEDYFFYIFEAGLTPSFDSANGPLAGAYRAGLWYDPQPKASSDSNRLYRDDRGFYVSFDQKLFNKPAQSETDRGLGVFFRYGYADSRRNDLTNFCSSGFQYQGLFEGRDNDVLGIGFARGFFSDRARLTFTEDYESVLELYYNAEIFPWLNITPDVQYVANPGGNENVGSAIVLGARVQMSF